MRQAVGVASRASRAGTRQSWTGPVATSARQASTPAVWPIPLWRRQVRQHRRHFSFRGGRHSFRVATKSQAVRHQARVFRATFLRCGPVARHVRQEGIKPAPAHCLVHSARAGASVFHMQFFVSIAHRASSCRIICIPTRVIANHVLKESTRTNQDKHRAPIVPQASLLM